MSRAAPDTRDSSRWIALVVLCAGMFLVVLDGAIVNVALPVIQTDLGFTASSLAWVVNAYLIAFGGLLLLAGRLGDLIGRRKVFLTGLVVFTTASALCGFSVDQTTLVAARFLQGVGGAMASSVTLGMIVTMFPTGRERAKAIGVFSFVASAGASIGLLLGGVLTQALSWHWIFFVNVPVGAATLLLTFRYVDADRGIGLREGADLVGAVLVTAAVMLGVYTIVGVAEHGWGSARTIGFGAVALVLLAGLVVRLATARRPLVPLRLFRSRHVTGANVILVLMVAGMFGMFFLGALYLQRVLGFDEIQTGFGFLPVSVAIGALSLDPAERLINRFGARPVLITGLAFVLAGLLLFARVPVAASYLVDLLPMMTLFGIGAGLTFPATMTLAMSGATSSDSGIASGLTNTSLQVGGALGLSVLSTVAAGRTAGRTDAASLTDGYHLAFGTGAVFVLVAIVLAVTVLRGEPAGGEEAYPEDAHEEQVGDAVAGR